MKTILYMLPFIGCCILMLTAICALWIRRQDTGNAKMLEISDLISQGASSFLKSVYKRLFPFVLVACSLLLYISFLPGSQAHPLIALTFFLGAFTSALSGWIGMKVATKANVRTTEAARFSLSRAFKISFLGGTVMGMGVTGLAILGISTSICFLFYFLSPTGLETTDNHIILVILETITGFALGAESVALFARVAGGIYTKAADIGADLVGKIEANIPEDDPRNPATIADNVGDNVGDVAGMGADLFGSYVSTILAAMLLGSEVITRSSLDKLMPILFPLFMGVLGTLLSIVTCSIIKVKESG